MATLTGTYEFDLKRETPTGGVTTDVILSKAVVWTLAHQLLGDFKYAETGVRPTGAWELIYCSNGWGSGGSHGAIDYWWDRTGTFGNAKFDAALMSRGSDIASNQGGCMMALRAPAAFPGTRRPTILVVHQPPGSGYDYDWRWYVTDGVVSAPATMGMLPTTTTTWASTSMGGGSYDWLLSLGSETTTRKCHLILATDGGFFWGCNKTSSVRLWNGVAVLPLVDPASSDLAPWAFFRGGPTWTDGATGWPSSSAPAGKSAWTSARCAMASDASNMGQAYMGYGWIGMRVLSVNGTGLMPAFPMFDSIGRVPSDATSYRRVLTSAIGIDGVRQTYPEFPVWLVDADSCVRGRLRDLWLTYPSAEGTVDPSGGGATIRRMIWGDFWVPAPNEVTPMAPW